MKNLSNLDSDREFSIGDLARRTGVKVVTIRYYEKIGMMPEPPRNEGGQRVYNHENLRRLSFIRRSRELGFSLSEVEALLQLEKSADFTCDEVKALTLEHVADIRLKITDLRRMERTLKEMAAQCDKGEISSCPILDTLAAN